MFSKLRWPAHQSSTSPVSPADAGWSSLIWSLTNRHPAQVSSPAASLLVAKSMSPSFFWTHPADSMPIKVVLSFSQQLETDLVLSTRLEHQCLSVRQTSSKYLGFSCRALQCLCCTAAMPKMLQCCRAESGRVVCHADGVSLAAAAAWPPAQRQPCCAHAAPG